MRTLSERYLCITFVAVSLATFVGALSCNGDDVENSESDAYIVRPLRPRPDVNVKQT